MWVEKKNLVNKWVGQKKPWVGKKKPWVGKNLGNKFYSLSFFLVEVVEMSWKKKYLGNKDEFIISFFIVEVAEMSWKKKLVNNSLGLWSICSYIICSWHIYNLIDIGSFKYVLI